MSRMKAFAMLQLWTVLLLQAVKTYGYKPVIIIHGILDDARDLSELGAYIEKAHPGTEVHTLDLFDHYYSFKPLWEQLSVIKNITDPIMKKAKNGVHLIGYSQGGLIGRGIIQTTDHHNVDSFIALSSPLNGQFGDTSFINWLLPSKLKEDLYRFFYTNYGQLFSIGNYWKDPHHSKQYRKYSSYLAALNNESVQDNFSFPPSWRSNFARLGKLVLIGGPDDGVIAPWQSAQFGCFNRNEKPVEMRKLRLYHDDVIGLKTLDKDNRLKECTQSNVHHTHWHRNYTVFLNCIEPWLT
uniref:palmitoyl-CoA hydrolase n=1 Tax=Phallusia mammillata TaxID=59560 RepID=A0A6F9DQ11_9ASCI|nr:lysosomal thioesterase PPT2-A-like [Phallusia mammillata]